MAEAMRFRRESVARQRFCDAGAGIMAAHVSGHALIAVA
jgi:hypothetical protein